LAELVARRECRRSALWNSDREHESGLSGLIGIIPAMGCHRYRHICGCSKSGNQFIANLIAALVIDLRQAQEAGVCGPAAVIGQYQAGFTSAILWR
jgi:hypothetical protein